jgi:hypothetical protein
MFDVGLILQTYGLIGVFIEITLLETINVYLIRDAIGTPCPIITRASRRRTAIVRTVFVFCAQLAAAYLSYFVARMFWRIGMHSRHIELLHADHCESDLTVSL